jgi:hypothetical protein
MATELPAVCHICKSIIGINRGNGTSESPAILPCGHIFGEDCIKAWIAFHGPGSQPGCPRCRFPLYYPGCSHRISPKVIGLSNGAETPIGAIDIISDRNRLPIICPNCILKGELEELRVLRGKVKRRIEKVLEKRVRGLEDTDKQLHGKRQKVEYLKGLLVAEKEVLGFYEAQILEDYEGGRRYCQW